MCARLGILATALTRPTNPAMRFHLAAIALTLLVVAPARSDARDLPLDVIVISGDVTGADGTPVASARVRYEGDGKLSVLTGKDGRYRLTLPRRVFDGVERGKTQLRIRVDQGGRTFATATFQPVFSIEFALERREDQTLCRMRSNMLAAVNALSEAVAAGATQAVLADVDFVEPEGRRTRVWMGYEAVVAVGAPRATSPGAPAVTAGKDAPRRSASKDVAGAPPTPADGPTLAKPTPSTPGSSDVVTGPDRIHRVGERPAGTGAGPANAAGGDGIVKLPGPGVSQSDASAIRRIQVGGDGGPPVSGQRSLAAALPLEGECACRIRGTVELHPDHLLTSRLRVIVFLRETPALRDTVELYMGSPRGFEFPAVSCMEWNLGVEPVTDKEFEVVSSDGREPVHCRRGGLQQLRIVLDPR